IANSPVAINGPARNFQSRGTRGMTDFRSAAPTRRRNRKRIRLKTNGAASNRSALLVPHKYIAGVPGFTLRQPLRGITNPNRYGGSRRGSQPTTDIARQPITIPTNAPKPLRSANERSGSSRGALFPGSKRPLDPSVTAHRLPDPTRGPIPHNT